MTLSCSPRTGMNEPTHVCGGYLDVVADLTVLLVCVHDVGLSDHQLLTWSVVAPPVVCRPWHKRDVQVLREALLASRPDSWTDCTFNHLADLYNNEITSILDKLITAKNVTIRRRPSDPWFDHDCRQLKRDLRRLEWLARSTGMPENTAISNSKRREYRALTRGKCEQFWREKINAEKSTSSQLWRSIDTLLGRGHVLPVSGISANQFHCHFDDKVAGVRSGTTSAPPPSYRCRIWRVLATVSAGELRGSGGCNSCTAWQELCAWPTTIHSN